MSGVEGLLRDLAPRALGALVRRHPTQFDACEDAVQESLLAAATQWPAAGVPDRPVAWLVTVASRRLLDQIRAEAARRRREDAVATPWSALLSPAADDDRPADDSVELLFLCCHPALSGPSQVALTLRAVGGLTTAQIAAAFLVPEATMAQRITRAKQSIRGTGFPTTNHPARLSAVLHTLYLIFNEGHTASAGPDLTAPALSEEAIRLTRMLPAEGESAGLLALMLLTDAHRPARVSPNGSLIPLAEQDRTLWNRERLDEGLALITTTLPKGPVGPYQLQAAIAAVHAEAPTAEATDWAQILALYDLLDRIAPNPVTTLNRAVAVGMVQGPYAALDLLSTLTDKRVTSHHRFHATRAHLLELGGDLVAAQTSYREAARRATSFPERRHLTNRANAIKPE
ncbi:DUF6596 domain-containing protein [Actinokineospora sp. NBRC 105648]|uniref:RNA polymerase sigma factor n=1 Tax=Actinokineospora sp. NBRC 105648 TaxID=3032206 RepID=UPI0024A46158|nr:DUF6596 domain-containing protein [Actinokineospora sp. NBRC 105648]GLZ36411.1 RNA polymerase sigma24 factor [Actinokineospora sp. NBRC 105648]